MGRDKNTEAKAGGRAGAPERWNLVGERRKWGKGRQGILAAMSYSQIENIQYSN